MKWDILKRHLNKVSKPARYVGGEMNRILKDPDSVDVRFLLAFPDLYEVGAAHLGSQILYHVLNLREDTWCERAYAPWPDMEDLLRSHKWPLYSLESYTPLHSFDIIGFSLQYELTYTNILSMLDLGGIPLLSDDRDDQDPLVIAGGPCAMAAESIWEFVDAFVLGDGEESVGDVVTVFKKWRESNEPRSNLLRDLSAVPGVYVPSLYDVHYDEDGKVSSVAARSPAPSSVSKRVLEDLESASFPTEPLIPLIPPIHDRAVVEIFRGCTQGCRFCQAGMLYRPVRERDPGTVKELAEKMLSCTGYEEVSLSSLSSADYRGIVSLLGDLVEKNPSAKISLPSLRVDSFSVDLANMLGEAGSSLTLAPEAGSQRMRDVINKRTTEEDILEASRKAFESGYSRIKLYFMIGLPKETMEDVRAIGRLALRIRETGRKAGKRPNVAVSVSGFVPKAHTPFQWEGADSPDLLREKQNLLRSILKGPGIEFRYHDPYLTQFEAIFARGDRRLSKAILLAYQRGARFDSWADRFEKEVWESVFSDLGIDIDFYAHRVRDRDEIFPWDHLLSGVRKSFLLQERDRAYEGQLTVDCRGDNCSVCGICMDFGVAMKEFWGS